MLLLYKKKKGYKCSYETEYLLGTIRLRIAEINKTFLQEKSGERRRSISIPRREGLFFWRTTVKGCRCARSLFISILPLDFDEPLIAKKEDSQSFNLLKSGNRNPVNKDFHGKFKSIFRYSATSFIILRPLLWKFLIKDKGATISWNSQGKSNIGIKHQCVYWNCPHLTNHSLLINKKRINRDNVRNIDTIFFGIKPANLITKSMTLS